VGGWFTVAGQGVYVRMQFGFLGADRFTWEQPVPAGASVTVPPQCIGLQFRNAIAGQVAVVTAWIGEGYPHREGDIFGRREIPVEPTLDISASGETSLGTPTIVASGKATTNAGTRKQLASVATDILSVAVHALAANTGLVYVGDSTVAASNGYQLSASEAVAFAIADLSVVYFDVSVSSEGVTWMTVT
jgi:hypothetical protein